MRRQRDDTLLRELQAAGASSTEARELAGIAVRLGQLKEKPSAIHKTSGRLTIPLAAAAGAIAVVLVVVLAHGTLPGNPLYPVQQASDSVAIMIHPSYRATVMMRRAEQVRVLVDTQAPSSAVLAALSDYQQQAKAYRAHYADYTVFEHCKDSLRQAANHATGHDRQAINKTLNSLQDV